MRYGMEQQHDAATSMRIGQRLADVLWHRDFEFAELLGGVAGALWGAVLVNPWASAFASSPSSFGAMAALMSEPWWGIVGMLLGCFQLGSMLFEHQRSRVMASFALFLFWTFIGLLIGISNPRGTGLVIYPLLGLSAGWACLRASRDTS